MNITKNVEGKFFEKVNKDEGCWGWLGNKDDEGYGRYCIDGKWKRAHRIVYTILVGNIPKDMLACHRCDNPGCVNPAHLFVGTYTDNNRDRANKGRNGDVEPPHYTGENHPLSKLTWNEVDSIRLLHASVKFSLFGLGNMFGVHQNNIRKIVNN